MDRNNDINTLGASLTGAILRDGQSRIVYALDKPLGESWAQDEIDYMVNKYMVEIEQHPQHPSRVVAMNPPPYGKPIYLTWCPDCSLLSVPFFCRWNSDSDLLKTGAVVTRKMDGMPGSLIPDIIRRMIAVVTGRAGTVEAELNGVLVSVKNGDTVEERWQWMQDEQERKHQEYINSDEYKRNCAEAEEKQRVRDAKRSEVEARAPKSMQLANEDEYANYVKINDDGGYGAAVVSYSERWARFMEAEMAQGKTVAECAKEMSHLADTEGITGFMYGCAVSGLAKFWKHGEELRRWHNIDTQIGSEGEKANESGGVLNPALLSVG